MPEEQENPPPRREADYRAAFLHRMVTRLLAIERQYLARIQQSGLLSALAHSHLFSLKRQPLSRGLAIGMFWMMMPIPFQMLPATLFCWLGFANLPIALLAVWISNPFTYLPIFYLEYKVGELLFHPGAPALGFDEFVDRYESAVTVVGNLYFVVLEGALVLGLLFAVVGYLLGAPLSKYLLAAVARRRHRQ